MYNIYDIRYEGEMYFSFIFQINLIDQTEPMIDRVK